MSCCWRRRLQAGRREQLKQVQELSPMVVLSDESEMVRAEADYMYASMQM